MRLTRRTLLRGAGGAALALPFLEATALSAATAPLRLVIMTHGQGTMLERWTPSGIGTEFALPQILAPLAALKHVATAEPTAAERLRAKRPQLLGLVKAKLNETRATLGAEDRQRLDAHAARVAEMETTLSSSASAPAAGPGPGSMCAKTPLSLPAGYAPGNVQLENLTASAQIKNLVMALACDTTRVASLQFSTYHAPTFDWLNLGMTGNWHDRVHNGGGNNKEAMALAFTWYTQMFHDLLVQMEQVNEGDGTLLDNSLVLWISEFGNGGIHSTSNLPVVFAGGLGGKLKAGRHLAFPGRPHNDLYTTVLNLFDQPDARFGHPGAEFNTGPLALS